MRDLVKILTKKIEKLSEKVNVDNNKIMIVEEVNPNI